MNELWYEKYRPDTLEDYIWSSDATSKQVNTWAKSGLRHVIFHGPSGTGKTTLALLLAKCYTEDVLFVRASVNNNIDFIREDVTEFCSSAGWDGIQVVIFDEAERLTKDSQEALRNVMDTFGSSVRFIFTCNEVRRIRDAIKSRAQVVEVKELDRAEFALHLMDIADAEGVASGDSEDDIMVVETIADEHYPDMRKSIDMLQTCSISGRVKLLSEVGNVNSVQAVELLEMIKENQPIGKIREVVSGMTADDVEDFYKFVVTNANLLVDDNKSEGNLIKIVGKYLYQHFIVAFPEINLLAAIVDITDELHNVNKTR